MKTRHLIFFAAALVIIVLIGVSAYYIFSQKGKTYYVSPQGNDSRSGLESKSPLKTIQWAINKAGPGDKIKLGDGEYFQDFRSEKNGRAGRPIVITGSRKAVIKGGGQDHIIEINHSFITLSGFSVDGLFGSSNDREGYRNKLIYVLGQDRNGVTGLKISNMEIKNAGGECVRLRYFAQKNEIVRNNISNCGIYDFVFNNGGKNGEGIYIGTAPEQLADGKNPTISQDQSDGNWIHNNVINTRGNECVDIKEGSSKNLIESNSCTGQKDKESGGLDCRGNNNIFYNNEVYSNAGAGIRLGGDTPGDGIQNYIYGNSIRQNRSGAIKLMAVPQAAICRNEYLKNEKGVYVGQYAERKNQYSRNCYGKIWRQVVSAKEPFLEKGLKNFFRF